MAETVADTRRLITKPQNLNDAYGPPSNFLEIDVSNPQTVGVGRGRFTTYEVRVKVSDEGEEELLLVGFGGM
uniref:Sorting nexin-3 n=1 Tax=Sphaerodactylus townsendi TaxID=933632 RepID=A0ACB8GCZ4_9SAUR